MKSPAEVIEASSKALDKALPEILAFITGIQQLAQQNFDCTAVTQYLERHRLSSDALNPYVFYRPDRYTRNLIFKSSAFELLLLCWNAGNKSAIHGHEGEKCWMRVELGSLTFFNYQEDPATGKLTEVSVVEGHQGFVDGPAIIHKVENNGAGNAYSLHLYARPFTACDTYEPETHDKKRIDLRYDSMFGAKQGRLFE